MAHTRKSGGQRKDKQNVQMREDVAYRKAMAHEPHPTTDQGDHTQYKPGTQEDFNRQPHPNQPGSR